LKIPDRISFKSLSEYKGAWRRFEESSCSIKTNELKTINYKLISDYAHHPTEIKVTLKAAREKFPHKKIWCIFQPHQYQRTFYLFKDFVKVLRQAQDKLFVDKLIITDIYDVAGREQKNIKKKVNSKKLIKEINRPSAVYLPKKGIINYLKKNLKGREVVIIMGAGDIYKITEDLLYRERG
jgi:UDP-N-acetylmuramate--alanine ligase